MLHEQQSGHNSENQQQSKLAIVRNVLAERENNGSVYTAGEITHTHYPFFKGEVLFNANQVVTIYTSPTPPLYDTEEFNSYVSSLRYSIGEHLTDSKSSIDDAIKSESKKGILMGEIQLQEGIGTLTVDQVSTVELLVNDTGLEDVTPQHTSYSSYEFEASRFVRIQVYSDQEAADLVYGYMNRERSDKDLEEKFGKQTQAKLGLDRFFSEPTSTSYERAVWGVDPATVIHAYGKTDGGSLVKRFRKK